MVELGQLEKHHEKFDAKGVNIVAASLDDVADAAQTQQQFPHLTVLSDHDQSLARAADVIGPHHSPTGGETVSPTTVLIDPTTLNRQGPDVGTQYRSAVFAHSPEQKKTAEEVIADFTKEGVWGKPIVTEVVPFTTFFKAEDYHQGYFRANAAQPYCAA